MGTLVYFTTLFMSATGNVIFRFNPLFCVNDLTFVIGVVSIMGYLVVPTYYIALSLNAFMGIRRKFQEETYQWVEKFIHAIAWCFPLFISIIAISTENINPHFPGCSVSQNPQGCAEDSDVPCQRGKDMKYLEFILRFGLGFLFLIFPPTILITMFCWIKKVEVNISGSAGIQQMREQARSQMLKSMAIQMSLYLFSFWFGWGPGFGVILYEMITGEILYGLAIFTNCLQAMHGFVFAGVYFTLPILVARKQKLSLIEPKSNAPRERTVEDIRADAARETLPDPGLAQRRTQRVSYIFNIFDGTPDEDSPWAKFHEVDDE